MSTNRFNEASRRICVFAASCSGLLRLSQRVGFPLALIGAASHAQTAVECLRRRAHGQGYLAVDSFQPLLYEPGWTDWRIVEFGAVHDIGAGIELDEGRLSLWLPATITTAAFLVNLHRSLTSVRLETILRGHAWLVRRSDVQEAVFVPPRYTMSSPHDFRAGAEPIEDIYGIDPVRHATELATLTARALRAIVQESVAESGEVPEADQCV